VIAEPLVSVIMPVFNAGFFVCDAIQSVLNQTYQHWELIIVNDGSTDDSKEIILSIHDPRISYIEQTNAGVSAARNAALRMMKGDFFCFLDADDEFTPNSLESRLNVFKTSESTAFVDGTIEIYDENLENLIRVRKADFVGDPFYELLKINPTVFFGPSWMIRNKQDHYYNFNEGMSHTEDLWFYFQISSQGAFTCTDKVMLKYRSHPNSAMGQLDKLSKGYSQLTRLVLKEFSNRMTIIQKVTWIIRIRKIMTLSYLGSGHILKGILYAITAR
jgi:glycosyltransferase involved in cell wall biosynthesis